MKLYHSCLYNFVPVIMHFVIILLVLLIPNSQGSPTPPVSKRSCTGARTSDAVFTMLRHPGLEKVGERVFDFISGRIVPHENFVDLIDVHNKSVLYLWAPFISSIVKTVAERSSSLTMVVPSKAATRLFATIPNVSVVEMCVENFMRTHNLDDYDVIGVHSFFAAPKFSTYQENLLQKLNQSNAETVYIWDEQMIVPGRSTPTTMQNVRTITLANRVVKIISRNETLFILRDARGDPPSPPV